MDDKNQTAEQTLGATPKPTRAEKRTVEAWAEEKGYLPQFHGGGGTLTLTAPAGQPYAQVSELGKALKSAAPRPNRKYFESGYAAARGLHAWPIGAELTEAEFDAACHKAKHQPI